MKKTLTFLLLLWMGCTCFPADAAALTMADSLRNVLNAVDHLVMQRAYVHTCHERRLDSIKVEMRRSTDVWKKYNLCGTLFYEYLHYQADSSLAYVERKARLLPRLNRPDLENEVRINRAEVMGVMGMYNEAGTELARVHKDALSTGGLLYYYHTQRAYHGWLADYTAYQPAKEKYLKITEAYRDSILSIIGPGLSTDIVRAERLLLAGNPDEALSLLASHDEDGMTMPNRAYLNYTLFEAWQKKGDVEHEIYYLARTALVDIRMAAREYASLQRLARLMYEQGDLARFETERRPTEGGLSREIPWSEVSRVIGRRLEVSMSAGQILQSTDLKPLSQRQGFSGVIQQDYRAVAIPVDPVSSVNNLIQPNDNVDVIGTFRFPDVRGDSSLDTVTLTILQNVKVLAVGNRWGANALDPNAARSYGTVTLLLYPEEVEMIVFAAQKGKLTLSLRNFEDERIERDIESRSVNFKLLEQEIPKYNQKREQRRMLQ